MSLVEKLKWIPAFAGTTGSTLAGMTGEAFDGARRLS